MIDEPEIDYDPAISVGSEDKYEAKVGTPFEDYNEKYSEEVPPAFPEEVIIPKGVGKESANPAVLFVILFAAATLIAAVALALCGIPVGSMMCACCFASIIITLLTVIFVREKIALSGKNVLGKAGTRQIEATVKEVVLHSTTTKRVKSHGNVFSIRTGAVYKITLVAEDKEFTALSRTYHEQGESVHAFVNGKNAYIDEDEK